MSLKSKHFAMLLAFISISNCTLDPYRISTFTDLEPSAKFWEKQARKNGMHSTWEFQKNTFETFFVYPYHLCINPETNFSIIFGAYYKTNIPQSNHLLRIRNVKFCLEGGPTNDIANNGIFEYQPVVDSKVSAFGTNFYFTNHIRDGQIIYLFAEISYPPSTNDWHKINYKFKTDKRTYLFRLWD